MSLEEKIREAQRLWMVEGSDSDLGLWWVSGDIRDLMPLGTPEEEVRRATLAALRPLLESGTLHAGDMLPHGKFKPWDGSIDEQLARIEAEWIKLGRAPDIGDIVWFIGPRPLQ
jgi:hypothetical protein